MTSRLISPETGAVLTPAENAPLGTRIWRLAFRCGAFALALIGMLLLPGVALAFPPAPHHLIYGTVRDQYGTPLMTDQAQVILVTPTGVHLTTTVVPGLGFEFNYQLEVPMDAGLTADPYTPNALMPGVAFTMYVVIGHTTNLPIQMTVSLPQLGQPAQQNRIDLTLGVDSNGDGIPDAWELAYLAELGSSLGLGNINANSVLGTNGLTVRQEYLAGYYPYDPNDTFVLQILSVSGGSAVLQFPAMTGRYYTLFGSRDLVSWVPLSFRVPAEGSSGQTHTYFYSPNIQTVQLQTIQTGAISPPNLGFSRSGSQIILSWPTNSPGFNLVSATSLKAPSWQPVVTIPSIVGNNYVVTNAMVGPAQFYRLASAPVHFFRLMVQ